MPDEEPMTEEDLFLEKLQKFLMASDLAVALRELSQVLNVSVIQLAEELGIPLDQLVELLGVELGNLTAGTAAALAGVAQLLGADIYELMDALKIGLRDLAVASGVQLGTMSKELVAALKQLSIDLGVDVLDLARRLDISLIDMAALFGITIDDFSAAQFQALAEFSTAIGASVDDVATQLGISLGELKDSTSILSQALDLAIAELPSAIQADLGPLLEAIRSATTEADANASIQNLGDYILSLPGDLSAKLIPFLASIGYQMEQTPEITQLMSINTKLGQIHATLMGMGGLGKKGGYGDPVDKTDTGTGTGTTAPPPEPVDTTPGYTVNPYAPKIFGGYALGGTVPATGLYKMHEGEFVVNPTRDNVALIKPEGDQLSSNELVQIRVVLEEIREQNRRYQESDIAAARGIQSSLKQQAEAIRRRSNG